MAAAGVEKRGKGMRSRFNYPMASCLRPGRAGNVSFPPSGRRPFSAVPHSLFGAVRRHRREDARGQ